ncbi:MAG: N-acetylmuramoyl-L-alanine amidase [Anaerolineales bacterium]|nr:N-acetylmuramoyl-L-alanine amidase [Anaerolineales bacterium]
MTCRYEDSVYWKQTYNAENRLAMVEKLDGNCAAGSAVESWTFSYDGNGVRLMEAYWDGSDTTTKLFLAGGAYEVGDFGGQSESVKRYYSMAGVRMLRDENGLQYLLTDHLGSVSAVLDSSENLLSEQRYLPFGGVREDSFVDDSINETDFGYTGQRNNTYIKLIDFNARWYSPSLNRFVQPDTIIPDLTNPQALNRYSYVVNNPINLIDPTGHKFTTDDASTCPPGDSKCWGWDKSSSISKIDKPEIVSREDWNAYEPGSTGLQADTEKSEGLFGPDNEQGYMAYPGDLADELDQITIHHVGDDQFYDPLSIQIREMGGGFYDIGYHFIIGRDGTIYEGRDLGVRGYHAYPNSGNVGILWLGDFVPGYDISDKRYGQVDPDDNYGPTMPQINATMQLIIWLDQEYGIDDLVGHIELNSTACPGANAMPYVHILAELVE